jgi:riboflavin synthase
MFTGLIRKLGSLASREAAGDSGRLRIETPDRWPDLETGESVAVEGVCLTVAEITGTQLSFDVLGETFRRTNLGQVDVGGKLNLERALSHGDKLGGHIMNGHVDGVGKVRSTEHRDNDVVLQVDCGAELLEGIVFKGCIACNGVSLTVAALDERGFDVHLIPETVKRTSLANLEKGNAVNLEIDVIGKYVREFIRRGAFPQDVTWEALRQQGLL